MSRAPEVGDTYRLGETIAVETRFTRAVAVTGSPQVALTVGDRTRAASVGDGATSSAERPRHDWAVPGFYRVSLTVSDGETSSTAFHDVLVEASDPAGTCKPDAETRCLQDSRYEVRAVWWGRDGRSGSARVAHAGTNDSALFWFFDLSNWEILVKVLDGCSTNGHFWVFGAATTDLGYRIRGRLPAVNRDAVVSAGGATCYASASLTHSKSPGLWLIRILGSAIQEA